MVVRLAQHPRQKAARIVNVGGSRPVRRRLLELGLTPGTEITVVGVSPLGDPLELAVRGSRVSIRKKDALEIEVEALGSPRERQQGTTREPEVTP